MAWTVTHTTRAGVATVITPFVRLSDLAASFSGTPVEQAISLTVYPRDLGFVPSLGSEILLRDSTNGVNLFRGWITAIERTDAAGAEVAGITNAQSWNLIVSSILSLLKTQVVPSATTPEQEAIQELPPGLRADQSTAALDETPMLPIEVLAWAVQLINSLEAAKDVPLPLLSEDFNYVVDPTVQVTGPSGLTDFAFTGAYAFFADGATYYELLDAIASISALRWWIDADLKLHTVDAIEPPVADIEITDKPADGPVVSGHTVLPARSISLTEDMTAIVNCVRVSYTPKDQPAATTDVKSLSSVAVYGERWEQIATQFRTVDLARAIARRRVMTARLPDYHGKARVRYTHEITPGTRVWVRQRRHGVDRLCYVWGVSPVFDPGSDTPVWLDVEFSRSDWQPPSWTPVIFEGGTGSGIAGKDGADTGDGGGSGGIGGTGSGVVILATATNDYAIGTSTGSLILIGVN